MLKVISWENYCRPAFPLGIVFVMTDDFYYFFLRLVQKIIWDYWTNDSFPSGRQALLGRPKAGPDLSIGHYCRNEVSYLHEGNGVFQQFDRSEYRFICFNGVLD